MIVEIDRTDICNMLSGVEPSYEEMDRLGRIGLGYYVGGFSDEWHWNKNRFKDFSDEELLQIYKSIRQEKWTSRLDGTGTFRFELSKEQRESLLDLFKPKVVDEWVEEMLNENNRLKREICEKIMAYCVQTGQRDMDGNLIAPETHEVDCDVDFTSYQGEQWAYAKQWYVRPKKSEYEK